MCYKPFSNFFRVGLKSHTVSKMQVTWTYAGRRIRLGAEDGASTACAHGPPDSINARALNAGVITVDMQSGGEHRDR